MKTLRYLISFSIITLLAACGGGGGGGGGGGTPTQTVTAKLSTTGIASSSIGGIGITLTLPTGVTPALNADGSVSLSAVVVSGEVVKNGASGSVLPPIYVAASGATKGTLSFTMASSAPAGFLAGEFATVVLNLTGAITPLLADFNPIPVFTPLDAAQQLPVTGLTAIVSSITIP